MRFKARKHRNIAVFRRKNVRAIMARFPVFLAYFATYLHPLLNN